MWPFFISLDAIVLQLPSFMALRLSQLSPYLLLYRLQNRNGISTAISSILFLFLRDKERKKRISTSKKNSPNGPSAPTTVGAAYLALLTLVSSRNPSTNRKLHRIGVPVCPCRARPWIHPPTSLPPPIDQALTTRTLSIIRVPTSKARCFLAPARLTESHHIHCSSKHGIWSAGLFHDIPPTPLPHSKHPATPSYFLVLDFHFVGSVHHA
jgi:hypothetical protein